VDVVSNIIYILAAHFGEELAEHARPPADVNGGVDGSAFPWSLLIKGWCGGEDLAGLAVD
jgi:hypothetical protein